jgi:hypothetical protein
MPQRFAFRVCIGEANGFANDTCTEERVMSEQSATALPPNFTERGRRAWEQYQQEHDVTHLRGQVAAVDPESGRVWIGGDVLDAVDQMNAEGIDVPLWFVRVGFDYLYVKGRR